MRKLLIILIIIFIGCNSNRGHVIKLVDEVSRAPVEGAWIHFPGDGTVLRSNISGEFEISSNQESEIEIISKYHKTESFNLRNIIGQTIELAIDSGRINVNEANLIFSEADTLIGSYNELRSNNDLLHYDLDVKVDINNKFIVGKNTIQFKMLEDAQAIQLDLHKNLAIDSIIFRQDKIDYKRLHNSVILDFPQQLTKDKEYSIDFHYSGYPQETGRFGGIVFQEDSLGNPWIFTACQGPGANVWWPNKDQQFDEPDSMLLSVTVPDNLFDVSNGHLIAIEDVDDDWKKYIWKISYPINNYCVALNIGNYVHFSDNYGDFPIDYYVLPYNLEKAKKHFKQVVPMLQCYEKHFGDYPFPKDGFKLIDVPYSGMEHQTAVSYGNGYINGYLGRDWTGVGISPKFDFIIIHESGHEWFGNSITAADDSDAWIHEGWTTYAEAVYVECMWGYQDALKYLNGYKDLMYNREPILGPTSVNHWPNRDMYFKGALFLNALRSIIDDDEKWWSMVYDYSHHFRGKNIYTTDVITYINQYFDKDLTKIFEQYLMFAELPNLQLKYFEDEIQYRWKTKVKDFNMPIKAGLQNNYEFIYPTSVWQSLLIDSNGIDLWQVDTDRFYIDVEIVD